jgi:hypothetical protein
MGSQAQGPVGAAGGSGTASHHHKIAKPNALARASSKAAGSERPR